MLLTQTETNAGNTATSAVAVNTPLTGPGRTKPRGWRREQSLPPSVGNHSLTALTPSVNHHGPVPQAREEEVGGVLQAQHRAALCVPEGHQALCGGVHAAIDQNAAGRKAAPFSMMNGRRSE